MGGGDDGDDGDGGAGGGGTGGGGGCGGGGAPGGGGDGGGGDGGGTGQLMPMVEGRDGSSQLRPPSTLIETLTCHDGANDGHWASVQRAWVSLNRVAGTRWTSVSDGATKAANAGPLARTASSQSRSLLVSANAKPRPSTSMESAGAPEARGSQCEATRQVAATVGHAASASVAVRATTPVMLPARNEYACAGADARPASDDGCTSPKPTAMTVTPASRTRCAASKAACSLPTVFAPSVSSNATRRAAGRPAESADSPTVSAPAMLVRWPWSPRGESSAVTLVVSGVSSSAREPNDTRVKRAPPLPVEKLATKPATAQQGRQRCGEPRRARQRERRATWRCGRPQ